MTRYIETPPAEDPPRTPVRKLVVYNSPEIFVLRLLYASTAHVYIRSDTYPTPSFYIAFKSQFTLYIFFRF